MIRLRALSEKMPGPQSAAVNATPGGKDRVGQGGRGLLFER
jgi:hypothetical protein